MIRISFSLIGESGFGFSTLLYLSITPEDEESKTLGYREREREMNAVDEREWILGNGECERE